MHNSFPLLSLNILMSISYQRTSSFVSQGNFCRVLQAVHGSWSLLAYSIKFEEKSVARVFSTNCQNHENRLHCADIIVATSY